MAQIFNVRQFITFSACDAEWKNAPLVSPWHITNKMSDTLEVIQENKIISMYWLIRNSNNNKN